MVDDDIYEAAQAALRAGLMPNNERTERLKAKLDAEYTRRKIGEVAANPHVPNDRALELIKELLGRLG